MRLRSWRWCYWQDVLAGLLVLLASLYKLYPSWLKPGEYLLSLPYDNSWIYAFPTRIAYNLAHDLPLRAYETIGYPLPLFQREILPFMRAIVFGFTSLFGGPAGMNLIALVFLLLGGMGAYCLFRQFRLPRPLCVVGAIGYLILLARDIDSRQQFFDDRNLYFVSASLFPYYYGYLLKGFQELLEGERKNPRQSERLLPLILIGLYTVGALFVLIPWVGLPLFAGLVALAVGGLNVVFLIRLARLKDGRLWLHLATAAIVYSFIVGLRVEMGYLIAVMTVGIALVSLLILALARQLQPRLVIGAAVFVGQLAIGLLLPFYLLFVESGSGTAGGFNSPENSRTGSLQDLRNFSPSLDHFINLDHPLALFAIVALIIGLILWFGRKKERASSALLLFGSLVFIFGVALSIDPEVKLFGREIHTLPYYLYEFGLKGFRRYGINQFSTLLFEWAAAGLLLQLVLTPHQSRKTLRGFARLLPFLPAVILAGLVWRFFPSPPIEVIHFPEPAVFTWLKTQPEGAVIEYPFAPLIDQIGQQPLFHQSFHNRPVTNGLEIPGKDYQLGVSLQRFDRYDGVLLNLLGARYLIYHPQFVPKITNTMTTDGQVWYFEPPPWPEELHKCDEKNETPPGIAEFAESLNLRFVRCFPGISGFESYVYRIPEAQGFDRYRSLERREVDLLAGQGGEVVRTIESSTIHPNAVGTEGQVTIRIDPPADFPGKTPVAGLLDIVPYLWGPSSNEFSISYSLDGKNFDEVDRRNNGGLTEHRYPQIYGLPKESLETPVYIRYQMLVEKERPDQVRIERLKVRWLYEEIPND